MISSSVVLAILLGTFVQCVEHHNVQELLVPLHSITPLMCEVIFNQDTSKTATWYRNGEPIAKIQGNMNVIFKNRTFELEEIPKVGFLIIPHISLEDQGDYWCSLNGEDEQNKVFRIRVAYIHPFPDNKLTSKPDSPQRTQTVIIDCPKTNAFPEPLISWQFNDEQVDFSSGRIEVDTNGSLIIRRFRTIDAGIYRCTLSNYAGHTSAQIELYPPLDDGIFEYSTFMQQHSECAPYFRNGMLWFLVGCLTTSSIVLLYLLGGLLCYKYSRQTARFTPLHSILRADPMLAPGFRKVVQPMPDFIRNPVENV